MATQSISKTIKNKSSNQKSILASKKSVSSSISKPKSWKSNIYSQAIKQQIEEGLINDDSKAQSATKVQLFDNFTEFVEDANDGHFGKAGKSNEMNVEDDLADVDKILNDTATGVPLIQIALQRLEENRADVESIYQMSESAKPLTHCQRLKNIEEPVKQLYIQLGQVLKAYRSGQLPRAFKAIIHSIDWEDLLMIMEPENWTPAAIKAMVEVFTTGSCPDQMCQRLYNILLLPRCRDEIFEFKKLNVYLYDALKIAIKRSGPFFKGIIIPLCESRTCTKLEAEVLSNVFLHTKVPLLHAAACMLKIAELNPYMASYTIFIRSFILKQYNLPYQVLDALVYHFYNFITYNEAPLLMIWHETLFDFCDKYGQLISNEQKQLLLELLKKQKHPKFTPQIRKLLTMKSDEENSEDANDGIEMDGEGEYDIGSNEEEEGDSEVECYVSSGNNEGP